MVNKLTIVGLVFVSVVAIVPLAFASAPYYYNVSGLRMQSPTRTLVIPKGATAECRDFTFSFSLHRQGTCSYHRGVLKWLR